MDGLTKFTLRLMALTVIAAVVYEITGTYFSWLAALIMTVVTAMAAAWLMVRPTPRKTRRQLIREMWARGDITINQARNLLR